ncbi:uncharacterized protein LOC124912769 [Impatiens glandulifera]|uniref:uncharacterized protein LOC124912769 n=1 Tax=Impatiens glandulifera TaxID=253017 RepID=UPI001FB1519C|nr:uncharacterized protein LOC124912769 [Impatiens glandulifera]
MHIHPNGKRKKVNRGYISLYLELVDASSFEFGWPINAVIKFFVLDQNTNKYSTTLGPDSVMLFNPLSKLYGIDRFIDLPTFELSSNGYLVNDQCVFGTEVLLVKQAPKVEMLILKDGDSIFTGSHIWKIESFSSSYDRYESENFNCGDFEWSISIRPKGNVDDKDNIIYVYLWLDESTLPKNSKVYAKYKICLLNKDKLDNICVKGYDFFNASSLCCCVRTKSLAWNEFLDVQNGFLVDNSCSIEVNVTILGVVNSTA